MNQQLRKRLLLGGGALITVVAAGVLVSRTPSVASEVAKTESPSAPIEITQTTKTIETRPNAVTVNTQTSTAATATAEALKPFENKTELAEFKILKQKVFLSEEEKEQRKNFLQDRALLENLKGLFKFPAHYQDLEAQQNVAVDLLLEAIKSGGDADTARAVFKELIADATIENKQLSPSERQNLAGVKAEVLYQWSSLEPERAQEMQNALPGPVSQKIWKNVQSQQENNEAESAVTK